MTATLPEVRYIDTDSVRIGDTIRVTHRWKDAEKTIVGTVKYIDRWSQGKSFKTSEGVELFTRFRSGHTEPYAARVTLVKRGTAPTATALFDESTFA